MVGAKAAGVRVKRVVIPNILEVNMSHTWETKYEPGNNVELHDGKVGTITQVHIMYPSGEDMDYWRKTLPKIADGKYQYTSYGVDIGGVDECEMHEPDLILVA